MGNQVFRSFTTRISSGKVFSSSIKVAVYHVAVSYVF